MKIMVRGNRMKFRAEVSVRSLLRKIGSGFHMLSNIDWVSSYGSHVSVVSVLGVAGLFLALKNGKNLGNFYNLLLPRDSSSKKMRFVPGLRNLGNNCYLNVVLQSLASCSSFTRFLDEVKDILLSYDREQLYALEDLPTLASLADLLEELSTVQYKKILSNPQDVMSSMQEYIPQFQLENQQDAAESLLHLLSCLREELSESYMPYYGSLQDVVHVDASISRILDMKRINNKNEPQRWRQQYHGPFDGILGSFLICRSCSSEIMMDFDFFHTLLLPLMFNAGASIPSRFTIEDCIKKFLSPEHIEYSCNRCWHIAAMKYLSSFEGHQEEICKLSCCSEQDSCDCRNMPSLEALPWSKRSSNVYKQLSIAYSPQILCLHLKRTLINAIGEPVKIQGHISFPLILNLSPFLKHEVGIQKQLVNKQRTPSEQLYLSSISHPVKIEDDSSDSSPTFSSLHIDTNKVPCDSVCSINNLYRLVSVVEHFGRAGSGHYTVYRGVRSQTEDVDDVEVGEISLPSLQWFCISDSEVHHASEQDVLGADASILFYERI